MNRGKEKNPWRTGHVQSAAIDQKKAQEKFEKERQKLLASAQKHAGDLLDSSSEEEDVEVVSILDAVLKNYSQFGGHSIGKTKQFIENSFQSGAGVCLICIASIKRADAVWNCIECFGNFHLGCIQIWSRDSLFHQKQAMEDLPNFKRSSKFSWGCPKCRHEYFEDEVPMKYFCYCLKVIDPPHHPWLVPHSCGETCDKFLQPDCGHRCLLLCHPGPCPPCPRTVKTSCYCGKKEPKAQLCSQKYWSCQQSCGKKLACKKHKCPALCHSGDCPPCPQQSLQRCDCGLNSAMRSCSQPSWKCKKVCGKPFTCGNHSCSVMCHDGPCGDCPLSLPRTCPCGKNQVILSCTEEVPTCKDTCGKILDCGVHQCSLKCHRDKCLCLEIVTKVCRCGQHKKEVQCQKEYLCDSKCKLIKNCRRHPCNRKCCDGDCRPCEKPCGRTLACGNHKCPSICHPGRCYPCPPPTVHCRCGSTAISVPCGRERKSKTKIRCHLPCKIPPVCEHLVREKHNCHFGECPPCRQICKKPRENCDHPCPSACHYVRLEEKERPVVTGPWDITEPTYHRVKLPCPPCVVPVEVRCLGDHETSFLPCSSRQRYSCGRSCGRKLLCGNHTCQVPCHLISIGSDATQEESSCSQCELGCARPRPTGCTHPCNLPCHSDPCPTCYCKAKVKCHCGISTLYIPVVDLAAGASDEALQCGNPCPKNYPCGHKCKSQCHSGPCPNAEDCRRKVKNACPCGRLKKDFTCDIVRRGGAGVQCDEVCVSKKEEVKKMKELELQKKKEEEERRNKLELEKFEKKMLGKKKTRERKTLIEDSEPSFFTKYWMAMVVTSVGIAFSIAIVLQQ